MAPKRKASASEKGKKPASSSSENSVLEYLTDPQRDRFLKHFQKKIISTPKFGMLSTFPDECFSFQRDFIAYGLEPLISSHGFYYPDLVRIFYSNMCYDNNKCYTYVLGKRIPLYSKTLGRILNIPYSGSTLYDPEDAAWENYQKREFFYSIGRLSESEYRAKRIRSLGGVTPARDTWSAGNFHIDDRLFHYFLVYILFPRAGNHCTVTDLELQIIYARKNGIPVNWAKLIVMHMLKVAARATFLPYAYFITRIMAAFDIDFTGFERIEMDPISTRISIKNVDSRMGVHFNAEAKTITYIGEDVVGDEGHNADEEDHEVPPPAAASGPTNQDVMDFMTQQFASLNSNINARWTEINDSTSSRIDAFQNDVNQQFSYLYSHLHIPPYDPTNPAPPPPQYTEPPLQQQFPYQGPF